MVSSVPGQIHWFQLALLSRMVWKSSCSDDKCRISRVFGRNFSDVFRHRLRGVVHNIAYLRFIEVARTLLAEQLGLPCGGCRKVRNIRSFSEPKSIIVVPRKLGTVSLSKAGSDRIERVRFRCASRSRAGRRRADRGNVSKRWH